MRVRLEFVSVDVPGTSLAAARAVRSFRQIGSASALTGERRWTAGADAVSLRCGSCLWPGPSRIAAASNPAWPGPLAHQQGGAQQDERLCDTACPRQIRG